MLCLDMNYLRPDLSCMCENYYFRTGVEAMGGATIVSGGAISPPLSKSGGFMYPPLFRKWWVQGTVVGTWITRMLREMCRCY